MKIGLYNLEPKVNNTAMMQVSQYHKQRGDQVEIYSPILHHVYDRIYAFSIFSYTPKTYVTPDMITGGTGFDVKRRLPPAIEACDLDYSIFPDCDTSYIWFSRGCPRKYPFCVVPEKEGSMDPVKPKNLNPDGTYITVMDNNFFANPRWSRSIEWLQETQQPVLIEQGIDLRILTKNQCNALITLPVYKQVRTAWDNPREEHQVIEGLKLLLKHVPEYKVMVYVLIGYWSTPREDLHRVEALRELGVEPFVMPINRQDPYQMHFARWVNRPAIFHSTSWLDYWNGKVGGIPIS